MFVIYIFCLFGCDVKNKLKRLFSVTLPSALAMTLGKVTTWELSENMLCRVQRPLHSANITDLPSATCKALGKGRLFAECLAGGTRQSGNLCRVFESTTLGKEATFAECLARGSRQICDVCRVQWPLHSAKHVPRHVLRSSLCRVLWPLHSAK